jgi:hypothetical protein
VTDILGSLDAYRRNVMKKIRVDAFTFEVARALGTDLTTRMGAAACCQSRQDQLFAIILAMEKMGFVDSKDSGREELFIFSARVRTLSNEMPTHQWESLFQSHVVLKLKKSELSDCAQLSNDVVAVLDVSSVESCWRRMRSIIDLVLDGTLMVFQHEAKSGLICLRFPRSAKQKVSFVWCSLKSDSPEPILVEVEPSTKKLRGRTLIGMTVH